MANSDYLLGEAPCYHDWVYETKCLGRFREESATFPTVQFVKLGTNDAGGCRGERGLSSAPCQASEMAGVHASAPAPDKDRCDIISNGCLSQMKKTILSWIFTARER
jgi:hypothetical protein